MTKDRRWLILGVWMIAMGAAGCRCDDDVRATFPRLTVDRHTVDFGETVTITGDVEPLVLRSEGTGELVFSTLSFTGPDAEYFSLVEPPADGFSLGPGATRTVEIAFTPPEEGEYEAELVIETNDADSPLAIALAGIGIAPRIRLCRAPEAGDDDLSCADADEPLVLDFGRLLHGDRRVLAAIVENVGEAPLHVGPVDFGADVLDAGFAPEASTQEGHIPAGGSALLPISFLGEMQGQVTGRVVIGTNDPDAPEVWIDLVGEGMDNRPPVACAAVTALLGIDGVETAFDEPAAEVRARPRDRAFLTAHPILGTGDDCSYDVEDGHLLRYEWTVVAQPDGEDVVIHNPTAGPAPGTNQVAPAVDLGGPGVYRLALVVYDSLDAASSQAEVVIDASPDDDLVVELAWHVGVDLDLHLIAPGPGPLEDRAFCTPLDCFWATCGPDADGNPTLHWGDDGGDIGDDGDPETDPLLRFDNPGDTIQPGSETLRLETLSLFRAAAVDPDHGPYHVGVHYFASNDVSVDDFEAEVTVIHKGEVLYRTTRTFEIADESRFWIAGTFDAGALAAGAETDALGQPVEGQDFTAAYTPPPAACGD